MREGMAPVPEVKDLINRRTILRELNTGEEMMIQMIPERIKKFCI